MQQRCLPSQLIAKDSLIRLAECQVLPLGVQQGAAGRPLELLEMAARLGLVQPGGAWSAAARVVTDYVIGIALVPGAPVDPDCTETGGASAGYVSGQVATDPRQGALFTIEQSPIVIG